MKSFRVRYHPPGTAPGSLLYPPTSEKPTSIDLTTIYADRIEQSADVSVEQCSQNISEQSLTWIHVSGNVDVTTLKQLGELLDLHPLAMEDVLNHGQRPKVETYGDQLFIVMNAPVEEEGLIHIEQVSVFSGKNFLLSFHERKDIAGYELINKRLKNNSQRVRQLGQGYLLYILMDLVVDSAFPVLDFLGDQLDEIDENISELSSKNTLKNIHSLKRELAVLRRALWPQRDMINALLREEQFSSLEECHFYLRDCYDHSAQIMELIESYRDMASSIQDVYLSTMSYRLNDTMRFLTIISTLFIPPTFIAGIYGMNFHSEAGPLNMPELNWPYGYLFVWMLVLASSTIMLVYLKYKRWF